MDGRTEESPPPPPATPVVERHDDLDLTVSDTAPVIDFVPTPASGAVALPDKVTRRVLVYAVHDGDSLPRQLLMDPSGRPVPVDRYVDRYLQERDWGAWPVARALAGHLGLRGAHRVRTARVLMDFGRFPGETRGDEGHLQRFAINRPFNELLSWRQKRRVLAQTYDRCSDHLEQAILDSTLFIGLHTYDPRGPTGRLRTDVSLIARPFGYRELNVFPLPSYDRLYPRELAQFTADRILLDRLSLTLEKARVMVGHDFPYLLPEGALEVRSQVFFFFRWLRDRFEEQHPDTVGDEAFELVWDMLLDTNQRSVDSEALRSYLHRYREAPMGRKKRFRRTSDAYGHIREYLADGEVARAYRNRPDRPSSLAIEVRKDLVMDFDEAGRPLGVKDEAVDRIARLLARAVAIYAAEDRPQAWR